MSPRIVHVVGARPNFMKVAPLLPASAEAGWDNLLVHTGQHYDAGLSDVFFQELGLPEPDAHLGVGSGTHVAQIAAIMSGLEEVLDGFRPDLVVVVGDVNSTLAGALCATKMGIPVAHVEAGLRSGDWSMPEEVNRVLTDRMAELCFTPSRDADRNLAAEGIPAERVHFVGNIMVDTLRRFEGEARRRAAHRRYALEEGAYVVATLHRPANVDDPSVLAGIMKALDELAGARPVVLPLHPRTARSLERFGIQPGRVCVVEPLGYLDMLSLMADAGLVITDSGGIQEETTALGVPCLTLRASTERPVTITQGTNRLVPQRTAERIVEAAREHFGRSFQGGQPELWDGQTAGRIVDVLRTWMEGR